MLSFDWSNRSSRPNDAPSELAKLRQSPERHGRQRNGDVSRPKKEGKSERVGSETPTREPTRTKLTSCTPAPIGTAKKTPRAAEPIACRENALGKDNGMPRIAAATQSWTAPSSHAARWSKAAAAT
jgi:hypothetical protein